MRIIFNQTSTIGNKTGVGHCAHQLLAQLRRTPEASVAGFPSDRWIAWRRTMGNLMQRLQSLKPRWTPSLFNPLAGMGLLGWMARKARRSHDRHLERLQRRIFYGDEFDLYHEPNFIPIASSLKTITTLHDLSVLLHPEWHPRSRLRWYEDGFPQTLQQSTHFITVSEFTRRQVQRYLHIPANRVTCVHNAARPEFQPLPRQIVDESLRALGLPARYLLYVGTIEPRKNILRLMQAYCALPASVRLGCPLLLVGAWGWNVRAEQDYYQEIGQHGGVRQVGYVGDEHMPAIYNAARALIYPSFYEGFGLPPLEMLSCGGAVIASNIEPIVEVVGRQGHLIDPRDSDGLREAMLRVIVEDDWWQYLRDGAEQAARQFSWEQAAAQTLQVYRKILGAETTSRVPLKVAA